MWELVIWVLMTIAKVESFANTSTSTTIGSDDSNNVNSNENYDLHESVRGGNKKCVDMKYNEKMKNRSLLQHQNYIVNRNSNNVKDQQSS